MSLPFSGQVCKLARLTSFSMLISCFAYSSNLKTKATGSSEISIDFQRATRRYIPDDKLFSYEGCSTLMEEKQPLQKECFNDHSRNYSAGSDN
jgi:hypothetical protein